MNRYITYTAMAKLRHLLETNVGVTAIRIETRSDNRFNVSYQYSKMWDSDILICANPYVVTDIKTLRQLSDNSIDFDYPSDEFIITRQK